MKLICRRQAVRLGLKVLRFSQSISLPFDKSFLRETIWEAFIRSIKRESLICKKEKLH